MLNACDCAFGTCHVEYCTVTPTALIFISILCVLFSSTLSQISIYTTLTLKHSSVKIKKKEREHATRHINRT